MFRKNIEKSEHMNLILPAAGQSTRFPNLRPKWLLTHPNGNLMIVESIRGLDMKKIENVYVTVLQKHLDENFVTQEGLLSAFSKIDIVPKITVLDVATKSQPETVYQTILQNKISGSIFIKDVDNYFSTKIVKGNYICVQDLHDLEFVNASNKSYVLINDKGMIDNIVEKKIISSVFCVGGYSFENSEDFITYYEKRELAASLFISHMVFDKILDNKIFVSKKVKDYSDWGTLNEWNKYKSDFMTVFLDIDGVLLKNGSRFFSPKWEETEPLIKNIEFIKKLYATGKIYLIITTSRKEKEVRKETIEQLRRNGIKYDQILFNLPHAQRIIVNDFTKSNPYRSCDSINIARDEESLENYFNIKE